MNNNTMELNLEEMELIDGGWNWRCAIAGGIFGAVGGAGLGGIMGGPIGAGIGAVVGGAVGAYGGGTCKRAK